MPGKTPAVPSEHTAYELLYQRLDNEADTLSRDDDSLQQWIQEKLVTILEAGTFEEINNAANNAGLTASKYLVGQTFTIRDFVLRQSSEGFRGTGLNKYAIIQAVTDAGEEIIIDGGGDTFITQLVSMRDHYSFPFTGTLLGMRTGSGYDMLYWRFVKPVNPDGSDRAPLY